MKVDRDRARRSFSDYVSGYDLADGKIALKAEHTLRVAGLCERIAKSARLDEADIDASWLTGLLHDIGRFEQVRRWNTFYDSKSVDHAQFGADLLFEEGLIERFVDECDPAIEIAIRNHNKLRVDAGLDMRTQALCDVLRDADKIDILRVNVERPSEEIYGASIDEIMASGISPDVETDFYACRCADRAHMQTLLDRRIGHLCFAFEIVYPYALEELKSQGYLSEALDLESPDPQTETTLCGMRKFMCSWLSSHGNAGDTSQ